MIEEKYLWPLVGLFLGWLLSNISSAWKVREDNRKCIGQLLSKLIRIYQQLKILKLTSEKFKDNIENWGEYETHRKGLFDRHFLESDSQLKMLVEAIDNISGVYPVESLQLQALVDSLSKLKNMSLTESSKKTEVYVPLLSLHEVGLDVCEKELLKSIKMLAIKHSVVTYIKVLFTLKKGTKHKEKNNQFIGNFMGKVLGEIKNKP